MIELYHEFFDMLYLAKSLHDSIAPEKFRDLSGDLALDCDMCYELAYDAMAAMFEFTVEDYNEDLAFSTWVFSDPGIDNFCRPCREYEDKCGIREEQNPYRREMQRIIRDGFEFPSYDYTFTWYLSAKDRGRKRFVLFTGMEFNALPRVPLGLLEIREGFDSLNQRLENELQHSGKLLQLPVADAGTERREAA